MKWQDFELQDCTWEPELNLPTAVVNYLIFIVYRSEGNLNTVCVLNHYSGLLCFKIGILLQSNLEISNYKFNN